MLGEAVLYINLSGSGKMEKVLIKPWVMAVAVVATVAFFGVYFFGGGEKLSSYHPYLYYCFTYTIVFGALALGVSLQKGHTK